MKLRIHRYEPKIFPVFHKTGGQSQLAGAYSSDTVRTSSLRKGVYDPRTFIPHAVLLHQAFAHCGKFLTAASRRSLGRISVPVWPITLSGRLLIVALVGSYPTNQLMSRRLILRRPRRTFAPLTTVCGTYPVLPHVSTGYPQPEGQITYVLLTRSPL